VKPGGGTLPMPRLPMLFPYLDKGIITIKLSLVFALVPVLSCLLRSPGELDVVLLLDH
jgi:hypothetical protein